MTPAPDLSLKGPERFALPPNERSIDEQMASLSSEERKCFDTLKEKWYKEYAKERADLLEDAMILRFACNLPGKAKFNVKTAWKVMKRFNTRYLDLTLSSSPKLERQLLTKTLFCVPGLLTAKGQHALFYMRPSRYVPSETPTSLIIDNLAYCMNHMVRAEKECTEGIAFMANMRE